jgi:hypothetical protein
MDAKPIYADDLVICPECGSADFRMLFVESEGETEMYGMQCNQCHELYLMRSYFLKQVNNEPKVEGNKE